MLSLIRSRVKTGTTIIETVHYVYPRTRLSETKKKRCVRQEYSCTNASDSPTCREHVAGQCPNSTFLPSDCTPKPV